MSTNFVFRRLPVLAFWFSVEVFATTPLFDNVDVYGQKGNLRQKGSGWLQLPHSDLLQKMRREEGCSAIGGPRGQYRVDEGKLWLYSLYRCRGAIDLNDVYPNEVHPILATWVTGNLVAEVGKSVCYSSKGMFPIYETEISMLVEAGEVKTMQQKSNIGHPDCR